MNWVNGVIALVVGIVLVLVAGAVPGILGTLCYVAGVILGVVGIVVVIIGLIRGSVGGPPAPPTPRI